ncbi:MAG: DUF1549 domain-containing protein [Singulisphaera sp.]
MRWAWPPVLYRRRVRPLGIFDVIGTLPTAREVKAFVADPDPDKRAKLIDQLLDRPEYAAYFATSGPTSSNKRRRAEEPAGYLPLSRLDS